MTGEPDGSDVPVVTFLALIAAVIGFWALRRERHGARAAWEAGALALVLTCASAGAWLVLAWRGASDGTPGALAGVVAGSVIAQVACDRLNRR